jgi:hypothetical protein
MVQHDVTSPNVYSRIHKISGTKEATLKYPFPGRISTGGEDWLSEQEVISLEEKYQPPNIQQGWQNCQRGWRSWRNGLFNGLAYNRLSA